MAGTAAELPVMMIPQFTYKGVIMTVNEIEEIEQLRMRDDDIWVCSFPRSGTTLMQEMTYLVKTLDFDTALTAQLDDRFPLIDVKWDQLPFFRGVKYVQNMASPRLVKAHLQYFLLPEQLQQSKGKVIYMARNPADVVVSCYRLLRWQRMADDLTFASFFDLFVSGDMYAGPWYKHVLGYWEHRCDPNVLFLKYEDVVKDLPTSIRTVATFLGQDLSADNVAKIAEHCSKERMRTNSMVNQDYVRAYRAIDDSIGGFINKEPNAEVYLTREMIETLEELVRKELSDSGLTFNPFSAKLN